MLAVISMWQSRQPVEYRTGAGKQSIVSLDQQYQRHLARRVAAQIVVSIVLLAAMLFIPAGTLRYWQAWIYLAILFVPMSLISRYLFTHDPELLERRMRMKEKEPEQRRIIALGWAYFLLLFLLPGFDRRFGWSSVDAVAAIVADLVVVLGYVLFVMVLKENRYASRIIEVEPGQRVVTTGPYAVVRHPMYLAVLLMCTFSPLALGSSWAMLLTPLLIILLVARIDNEEHLLLRDLAGYREYCQQVKYRLLPGIW